MRELSTAVSAAAISDCGMSAVDEISDGKSAVDDENWFSSAARQLLPHKAGTALHFTTGYDERLCQRYAAGHVKPSAYFFRALLRTDDGNIWLAAAMDGSDARWWREHKLLARKAALFDQARRIMAEING